MEVTRKTALSALKQGQTQRDTLCRTLRRIYALASDNDEMVELLINAMVAALKMNDRLKYYKNRERIQSG